MASYIVLNFATIPPPHTHTECEQGMFLPLMSGKSRIFPVPFLPNCRSIAPSLGNINYMFSITYTDKQCFARNAKLTITRHIDLDCTVIIVQHSTYKSTCLFADTKICTKFWISITCVFVMAVFTVK